MRIVPWITIPRLRLRRRKIARRLSRVSIGTLVISLEVLGFILVLLFVFTGKRSVFLDDLGDHADAIAMLFLLAGFASFHYLITRRVVTYLERYASPRRYEERRIFSGLGQEARLATSIEELYAAIARRIGESLDASDVSILVREETSADYVCVAFSSNTSAAETSAADKTKLRLAHDAFVVKRLSGLSTPLVLQESEMDTWARALDKAPHQIRLARTREHESLRLLKSHLLVQIRTKDQMVGILSLGLRRGRFGYSTADRETLVSVAGQLALIIENSRLTERMVAQERLTRELVLAAEVQRRLLPSRAPEHISLQLAGFCEPARGVGGDYYDFIALDREQVGVAIADVAGKGMPAALLMSTVQATLRSLTVINGTLLPSVPSLAQMVGKLNRLVFRSTSGENYVTFFYALFDHATHRLTYVNAGHNPPLYLQRKRSNEFHRLTAGGLIAGVFEHSNYEQETIQMESDDLLFLYTDGLTEATNRTGEEFGEARVQETLTACAGLSVNEIRDQVLRRVKDWCTGIPLYDDLTFVVMKVK